MFVFTSGYTVFSNIVNTNLICFEQNLLETSMYLKKKRIYTLLIFEIAAQCAIEGKTYKKRLLNVSGQKLFRNAPIALFWAVDFSTIYN